MTSPTVHEQPQFAADAGLSNLDRCNWCGELRSAHGPDWSCPTRQRSRAPVILLILGSLLAVGGAIIWAISTTAPQSVGTLAATCLFIGITIVVAAVITLQRRSYRR